jgi:Ca2+-binding EF-hand superfamily protein
MKVPDSEHCDHGPDTSWPEQMANKFMEMDIDNDGEISWEEFRTGAINNEEILNILQIGS